MSDIIKNKICDYSEMFFMNGPISAQEFTVDKYNKIHDSIFNSALSQYIHDFAVKNNIDEDEVKDSYRYIEIKGVNWYDPSTVIAISKKFPHTHTKIHLDDYWDNYQYNNDNKDIQELFVDEDIIVDAEVVHYNYVDGKATMHSRLTDKDICVPFNYINAYTMVSEDMLMPDVFDSRTLYINKVN